MDLDLGSLLTTALGVLAIATAAGLGLMRGTVTNLRESLADSRADNADLRARQAEHKTKIDQQATQLEALGKVVTGEVHWMAISGLLDEHHDEARAHWRKAETVNAEMLAALRAIRAASERDY